MDDLSWLGLLFWLMFTHSDGITNFAVIMTAQKLGPDYSHRFFKAIRKMVYEMPPGWVFSLIWVCIYPLIAVAIFLYWKNSLDSVHWYDSVIAVYAVNIILNHLWWVLFFMKSPDSKRNKHFFNYYVDVKYYGLWLAAIDTLLIYGTSLYVLIRFGISHAWVSFGLYIIYPIWLTFATWLSIRILWFVEDGRLDGHLSMRHSSS